MIDYSIGITTYSKRYDKFLINLMSEIRKDINNEIILGINGDYHEEFNENYRKNILELSTKYDKVFPFIYTKFRSLSKLWNNIVINASHEYVLILNDDISITNSIFWETIETVINKHQTSFKMDNKFCYFIIKKSELNEVGWFNERLLGIGWEDNDFSDRYEKQFNRPLLNIVDILGIKRFTDMQDRIVNQRRGLMGFNSYSEFNREVYNENLIPIQQYPYEDFFWKNYNKL